MATGEPEPFKTEAEYREAEAKVLHPHTDTHRIAFGDTEVTLRPLTIGPQNRLVAVARQAYEAFAQIQRASEQGDFAQVISMAEIAGPALVQACVIIAQFYRIPNADKDWVENSIDDGQAMDILIAQLERGSSNSFLRNSVRPLLLAARETFAGVGQVDLSQIRTLTAAAVSSWVKREPTPASANPGGSPSAS